MFQIEPSDSVTIVTWVRPEVITSKMEVCFQVQSVDSADAVCRKLVVKVRCSW